MTTAIRPFPPCVHAVPTPDRRVGPSGGFTLIETALVTVIIGVAVLAIVSAQQAFHQQNDHSQRIGAALLLANEIREMTLNLPHNDPITGSSVWGPEVNELSVSDYDDLDDFDGVGGNGETFSPPIDALRQSIPDMPRWSQQVTVENVDPKFINSAAAAPDNSTEVVRITCRVLYQQNDGQQSEITRLSWVRTRP